MKKFVSVFLLSFIALLFCAGCKSTYTPDPSMNYFKAGNVYRTLALVGEPQEEENYPLESFMPVVGSIASTVTVNYPDWTFKKNTLFFKDCNEVNKDGVILLYKLIGIIDYPEVGDLSTDCLLTDLYTYNSRIPSNSTGTIRLNLSDKPERTVLGYVSDVKIYTVNYTDLSVEDGTVVNRGSFEAIICGDILVTTFVAK